MTVIYPGTFDPITNGHLDILNRALKIFNNVVVLVSQNPSKKTLFTFEERVDIMKNVFKDNKNVTVEHYDGLIVDYIKEKKIRAVIRGLRAVSDFEYEFQMALTNRQMNKNFEVLFFMTDIKYTYLSSSIVKELAKYKADISSMVPEYAAKKLKEKF